MNRSQAIIVIFWVTALLSLSVLAACTMNTSGGGKSTPTATITSTATVNAAAQQLMTQTCSRCHALSRVTSKTKDATQWKITLDRMIRHGARLTADQEQMLVQYLAATY